MKLLTTLVLFIVSLLAAIGQSRDIDSILRAISAEKDQDKKVELITTFYTPEFNNDPTLVVEIGMRLLKQSQIDKNIIEESCAYSFLGQGYRLSGNNTKGLAYHHKAINLAEKSGNMSVLAMAENQTAHIYKDRGEFEKAVQYYLLSSTHAEQGSTKTVRNWPLVNLGNVYLSADKLDSSLIHSQRAYESSFRSNDKNLLMLAYINLAGVQSKLGNAPLSVSYYNMAIREVSASTYNQYFSIIYTGLAEHYQRARQMDSSELYARKAINMVDNTPFFYLSSKPALLLSDIFEDRNCDSTLKYTKIFKTANDSLNSNRANQQILLMTFDEEIRQQEIAAEKINVANERKRNIQYVLIALGIIGLLFLYLILSRSFITNTRLIEFFGVIALLIVFEFLNLLLHPFLERVTGHSPFLMLLALVGMAGLLVPLHHKMEKWTTRKMIEKNKKIRLAAAKKTIQQLEKAITKPNH